jgi:hypothetical protein
MQNKVDEINVLIYADGNTIYFLSSSVIADGLIIAKNEKEKTISRKIIANSNYGYLKVPHEMVAKHKTATICINSNEINYEKKLIL